MSVTAWRITKAKYAATAFTGEGAKLFPGRWNRRGDAMVYTAGSMALAVLEILVHLKRRDFLERYVVFRVSIPPRLVYRPRRFPTGWSDPEPPEAVAAFGSNSLTSGRGAVLRVPSAIIPAEYNFLLNPAHPQFEQLSVSEPEPFQFDPRLYTV